MFCQQNFYQIVRVINFVYSVLMLYKRINYLNSIKSIVKIVITLTKIHKNNLKLKLIKKTIKEMEVPGNILNHAFRSKSLYQQFFLKIFGQLI